MEKTKLDILTYNATAKTTLADADRMSLVDSADSKKLKHVTWANIKASLANLFITGTNKIGNGANYTEIESDGTVKFVGDATVFNDINTGLNPRNTGVGRPALATFAGNLLQFQFAVDDFADLTPIEFLHNWKEGSAVEIHCHWATGGLNDTTVRGVKWEVEYSWGNTSGVFTSPLAVSVEASIPADALALTHRYTPLVTFTPTGGHIGSQLCFRIKRIASVTNVAPVANPFLLSVGIHYEIDTVGSRTISTK